MNRRSFINKGIAAATACYGLNSSVFSAIAANTTVDSKRKHRIGIQLYSIREQLPDDFKGSLQKLADMGYSYVEAYGFDGNTFFGKTLKEINTMVKDMGMKFSGTLCGLGLLPADTQSKEWDYWRKTTQAVNDAGGKLLVQSWLPASNLDELKYLADQFNKIGEICKKDGLKFGYHNHHGEFGKMDGHIIEDFLLQNTEPDLVFFQFDLGHALHGEADISAYLRKYPKRFLSWHATDFKTGQDVTELGQGDVPYDELFKLAKISGLEYLIMEHEKGADRFAVCRRNFDFLSKYSWTKHKLINDK
jgi:sugar phosphate isomerase/epimerase